MTTSRQTEPSVNNALSNLLRGMMPTCTVRSENTQTFTDYPGRHADVLVTATGRSPVVVEAEFEPAPEAEDDARERLGLKVNGESRAIEAAVALRYPADIETAYDLDKSLREATLSYCALYGDGVRFPESGWLQGTVEDVADLVRMVSVPQKEVEQAADTLERGIEDAAVVLDEMAITRPYQFPRIAALLGMADVPQTRRMACAILANALIFHERISGIHQNFDSLQFLGGGNRMLLVDATLEAWDKILEINYYPIFAIARDILMHLPAMEGTVVMERLCATARQVNNAGVDNAHDLTGRIFQRLIADRKYLATFYTRPASAALLARLAVAKLEGVDWGDAETLGKLRVGDFACGTGALLSAVYEQVAARHELAGGDVAALHPAMMEEVLYGCDVMPSAIHITSSTLSGLQPNVDFGQSRLYTMPYGRQADGSVKIGSLELLQGSQVQTLFNTSDPALRTGSAGEETAAQVMADLPDKGFDLVIMNPPFTRAGSDWEGSDRDEDAIKQFRGLSTDLETQREMAGKEKQFGRNTCSHGYAGIASSFAALAHRKLKSGGVLALVMPLSAAAGISWRKFRQMLVTEYTDIMVLSSVASGQEMSFSSDTGMAECLIVARKLRKGETSANRVSFVSLNRRPTSFAYAAEAAKSILNASGVRQLEDGPYDGTSLHIGEELAGKELIAHCSTDGAAWAGTRIADFALAQTAHALTDSRLWLPGASEVLPLKIAPLTIIDQRGLYHRNIASTLASAPFIKAQPKSNRDLSRALEP